MASAPALTGGLLPTLPGYMDTVVARTVNRRCGASLQVGQCKNPSLMVYFTARSMPWLGALIGVNRAGRHGVPRVPSSPGFPALDEVSRRRQCGPLDCLAGSPAHQYPLTLPSVKRGQHLSEAIQCCSLEEEGVLP